MKALPGTDALNLRIVGQLVEVLEWRGPGKEVRRIVSVAAIKEVRDYTPDNQQWRVGLVMQYGRPGPPNQNGERDWYEGHHEIYLKESYDSIRERLSATRAVTD